MQVVLHGQMGEQSIAEKPFGKNSSRSCGEGAMTMATVTLLQFKANDFLPHRVHFNNGTGLTALGIQRATAVRATFWPRHRLLAGDLMAGNVPAPMSAMAGLGAALALRAFERGIGFEGDFGRRSRGPKGTFFGGPFLIA